MTFAKAFLSGPLTLAECVKAGQSADSIPGLAAETEP